MGLLIDSRALLPGNPGWVYSQKTGILSRNGITVWTGYSGLGDGKNNPLLQHIHGVGPIPQGKWRLGSWMEQHGDLGPGVIGLYPIGDTNVFGRTGFYLHGDDKISPGKGSHGCIVKSPLTARKLIWDTAVSNTDFELDVVE